MIVVVVMMFCMVLVAVGAYLFLNRPQEGDECDGKDENGNYVIDDKGKCVLDSCASGYYKSGEECLVDQSGVDCIPTGTPDPQGIYLTNQLGGCDLSTCEPGYNLINGVCTIEPVKARYVKIIRDKAGMGAAGVPVLGNHHLNLMEAKVMSGGENIAFQKNTTSSSTHAGLSGGRLVDGDMTTMAHTENGDVEWFLIDLGAEYEIDQVEIYNRTDSGGSFARTRGVQIKISKNADMSDSVDSGFIQVSQVAFDKPKLTWVPKDGPDFIASA
jgi:hypothetical protein